jgi:hypothetical protein
MPNHVTTIMTLPPEVLEPYLTIISAEMNPRRVGQRFLDFGKIIPVPDDYIRGDCSHDHSWSLSPDAPEPFPHCWYVWNVKHWGTKWNSYDNEITGVAGDQVRIKFDTAWSHPFPIIETISEAHPNLAIEVKYADEDLGSNCGTYVMLNGVIVEETRFAYGDESLEFATQVKYSRSYAEFQAEWGE